MAVMMAIIMLFSPPPDKSNFDTKRRGMVESQIVSRGISDNRVIEAMNKVPREMFVPESQRSQAYNDGPLSIGFGQTISQPYVVALMTELLLLDSADVVLEVGTGSGYQAAILAEIAKSVYSIEIVCSLQTRADSTLEALGYTNIHTRCGDAYFGWPEEAPFDAIIVTAAPEQVPQPLLDQLKDGGRLVIPVGEGLQYLEVYNRIGDRYERNRGIPVRFVPMTGKAEEGEDD